MADTTILTDPPAAFAAALIRRWREATAPLAIDDARGREVDARLSDLAHRLLGLLPLLAAAEDDSDAADQRQQQTRAVGRELATLHSLTPGTLERTQAVVPTLLLEVAAAKGIEVPAARLINLLSGITIGFIEESDARTQSMQKEARLKLDESHAKLALLNRDLVHELGERSQLEANLRDYAVRLENLQQVTLAILSAGDLIDVVRVAVDHLRNQIPAHCVVVSLFDRSDNSVRVMFTDCDGIHSGHLAPAGRSDILEAMQANHIHTTGDLRMLDVPAIGLEWAVARGLRSMMNIPLTYRSELLGSVSIFTDKIHDFSHEEQIVGREIANVLAIAIKNHQLLQAEQEARRREMILREVGRSVSSDLRINDLLQLILIQLNRVVASESATIFLRNDEGFHIVAHRGRPVDRERVGYINHNDMGGLKSVISSGQAQIIADTELSPNWLRVKGMEQIRGWLGVPLIARDQIIGVVGLDRYEPNSFTAQDAELALAFAGQAAVAIENARLFGEVEHHADELEQRVRERTRRLNMLYRITAEAVESEDLSAILSLSMQEVSQAFPELACTIHLLDAEGNFDLTACEYGSRSDLREAVDLLLPGDTLLSRTLTLRTAWQATPEALQQSEGGRVAGGFAAAPLAVHGQSMGVLGLLGPRAADLSSEDLLLLATVADQIAVAVESTSLRQRIRQTAVMEERERLGRDLHDVVTQSLYSLTLFADAASDRLALNDLTAVDRHLRSIQRAAQQALGEMRLLLFDLRSETLAVKGLVDALRDRLKKVEERAGIGTSLRATGADDLPPQLEDVYYRIALEALNNSLRHAAASHVHIDVLVEAGTLIMRIQDDGIGFDVTESHENGGQGLANMCRRVENIGGTFKIITQPGRGTQVEVSAPLAG